MRRIVLILLVVLVGVTGYRAWKARQRPMGEGFVTVRALTVWSRVAQVKEPVTKLRNGEHVWILEQRDEWSRVRTEDGKEGWVQNDYLTSRHIYEQFVQLGQKHAADPPQAQGHVRALSNLRTEPGRDGARLFQVDVNEKVEILGRAIVPAPYRVGTGPGQPTEAPAGPATAGVTSAEPTANNEEWYLVRSPGTPELGTPGEIPEIGWIYGRLLAFDPPEELLDYAEEKRFVGWFVLNHVKDPVQGPKNQYLVLAFPLRRDGEGEPCDFTQMRIFTWNIRAHRYETAFRQGNICGQYPARVLGSDPMPSFAVTFADLRNPARERTYQLRQTVVRRVK